MNLLFNFKKVSALVAGLLCFFQLTAQTKTDLKKNADVPWASEVFVDYSPTIQYKSQAEENLQKEYGISGNSFDILKFQVNDFKQLHESDHSLIHKLMQEYRDQLTYYKDSDLKQSFSPKEFLHQVATVDTVITYDPETYEQKIEIVINELNPAKISVLRVKQLLYYSKKEMNFKTIPLAIAPVLAQYDSKTESYKTTPICWIKVEEMTKVLDLNDNMIDWAKRFSRDFPLEDVKVFKEKMKFNAVFELMIKDLRENAGKVILGSSLDGTPMKLFQVRSLGMSVDTIITFDPSTYEEKIKIVKTKIEAKHVEHFRFWHDWVWDREKKQLAIRQVGFAPRMRVLDENGNFLYQMSLFIRKTEE